MKKLKWFSLFMSCLLTFFMLACSDDDPALDVKPDVPVQPEEPDKDPQTPAWKDLVASPDDWDQQKRGNISYQLLVYSFADSDGNQYGDIQGVINKLDYINSLGVKAIWLSPIHPSSSYHGYDVEDYTKVNPKLGSEEDFNRLVAEAHHRGIKVYLDYVLNHTSINHPWFVDAKAAVTSPYRAYYSFSENPEQDIKAGKVDMFANDKGGYVENEWYPSVTSSTEKSCYKFILDWSKPNAPTLKVVTAVRADADNQEPDTQDDKYLYFGDPAVCKKFYSKGNNIYELAVEYSSPWGFLVKTHRTQWGNHKYGAATKGTKVQLGNPLTLKQGEGAADILLGNQSVWFYHSGFWTASFADLSYGKPGEWKSSPAFKSVVEAAKGWIDRGVDGFRLDAVKHIYHRANGPENPDFLKAFYEELNEYYQSKTHFSTDANIYMVGEVLSGANEVAPYYRGLPALFEFDFWNRLEWAINNGTGCYFTKDILSYQQQYASYRADYIEATKLSNHDEDRTGFKLGKSLPKEKLAAAVLLTSAGEPYIYYGEELGFYGSKSSGDEHVREPMQWGDGTSADYMDKIQKSDVKSVAEQQASPESLWSVYQRFAKLRNTYPALAEGEMTRHAVYHENNAQKAKSVAAWYRTQGDQKMLVVHNFAASTVQITLDDQLYKAVGLNGSIQQSIEHPGLFKLGAYSTMVWLLK